MTVRSLDSSYPGVSYFLGRICLDDDSNEIALRYFETALRADPEFHEAQEYAQIAQSKIGVGKRPRPMVERSAGRLGRIFRRRK